MKWRQKLVPTFFHPAVRPPALRFAPCLLVPPSSALQRIPRLPPSYSNLVCRHPRHPQSLTSPPSGVCRRPSCPPPSAVRRRRPPPQHRMSTPAPPSSPILSAWRHRDAFASLTRRYRPPANHPRLPPVPPLSPPSRAPAVSSTVPCPWRSTLSCGRRSTRVPPRRGSRADQHHRPPPFQAAASPPLFISW